MAYTSQFNVWHLNGDSQNITPSASLVSNDFIKGGPIVSAVFNGILKDTSFVTACLIQCLIDAAPDPSTDSSALQSFTFNNDLTTTTDFQTALSWLLTNKQRLVIYNPTSTQPTANSQAAALAIISGGLYAAGNIRSDGIVFVNTIACSGSGSSITINNPISMSEGITANKLKVESTDDVDTATPSMVTAGGMKAVKRIRSIAEVQPERGTAASNKNGAFIANGAASGIYASGNARFDGTLFVSEIGHNTSASGLIKLRNSISVYKSNGYTTLKCARSDSSHNDVNLPTANGTLALQSDVKFYEHNIVVTSTLSGAGNGGYLSLKIMTSNSYYNSGINDLTGLVSLLVDAGYTDSTKACSASGTWIRAGWSTNDLPQTILGIYGNSAQNKTQLIVTFYDSITTKWTTHFESLESMMYAVYDVTDYVRTLSIV